MDKQELEETQKAINDANKLAKDSASGNVLGAAKDVVNLLKNDKLKKRLMKQIKLILIKITLTLIIIVTIAGALFGIFHAVTEKMSDLFSEIGDFATSLWKWVMNDYWIDIDEKIVVTAADGTQKEQTLVDHYMEQLELLGISLKD